MRPQRGDYKQQSARQGWTSSRVRCVSCWLPFHWPCLQMQLAPVCDSKSRATIKIKLVLLQGSADVFEALPDRGNVTRYPGRFYLPECWTRPISIEGWDVDKRTNHSMRKAAAIQSWQVLKLSHAAAVHISADCLTSIHASGQALHRLYTGIMFHICCA